MAKTFREYLNYLGGYRIGNLDSFQPMASLGDIPPKGQGGRDSRGVGLNSGSRGLPLKANYTGQAPGTMRPFLTANVEKKKIEMMKLTRQAMSIMPGSKRQKDIIKKIVSKLDSEGVARDINGYPKAPPSLRLWGGATVQNNDMKTLLPWIDWAYNSVKNNV